MAILLRTRRITDLRSVHQRPHITIAFYSRNIAHWNSFTNMPPSLPIVAASAGLLYVLWKLFRNYFISYSVDNLPHPPSKSLLFGMFSVAFGVPKDSLHPTFQASYRRSPAVKAGGPGHSGRTRMARTSLFSPFSA